ncbi:hypothetical protein GW7_14522 [Heterocephalus glaber]|uniref:Uncharacterized protein n=1 Tax=Heterocephalus glaber TaxID=10181 RepID=G5BUF8_HETGA|nr:hypothetical protein GW7_14522 [Heterocephalus glaber]
MYGALSKVDMRRGSAFSDPRRPMENLYNMAMTSTTHHAITTSQKDGALLNMNVNRAPEVPKSSVVHGILYTWNHGCGQSHVTVEMITRVCGGLNEDENRATNVLNCSGMCGAVRTVIVSRALHVLTTSGMGGALDNMNVSTALPHPDTPLYTWSCYNRKYEWKAIQQRYDQSPGPNHIKCVQNPNKVDVSKPTPMAQPSQLPYMEFCTL